MLVKARSRQRRPAIDTPLQVLAAAEVPAWQVVLQEAFSAAREAVDLLALRDAIDSFNLARVEEVMREAWWRGGHQTLADRLPAQLGPLVVDAARLAASAMAPVLAPAWQLRKEELPITAEISLTFGLNDARVSQWLSRYAGHRIHGIDQATLQGLREVLSQTITPAHNTRTLVEQLSAMIGLRPDQWATVLRYRDGLTDAGVKASRLQALVDQKIREKLMERAALIAQTETLSAVNGTQLLSLQMAADEGLIDAARTRRTWLIALDACENYCQPIPGMNPQGVGVYQPFQTPLGPLFAPPRHPRCRCGTGTEITVLTG